MNNQKAEVESFRNGLLEDKDGHSDKATSSSWTDFTVGEIAKVNKQSHL